jgi:Sigma-70 region 2
MATAQLSCILQQLRTIANAKAYEDTSDRELLQRFLAEREEAAFVALLKRHGPMVLQVCRRIHRNEHDVEDIFQATFLLLARKADSIRKLESVASWLHGVAHPWRSRPEGRGPRVRRSRSKQRTGAQHPGIPT